MLGCKHQRHEAAVRTTIDAEFARGHVAGIEEELKAVQLVLEVASTQVLEIRLLKVESVPGGAARIRHENDITARYQCLHIGPICYRFPGVSGLPRRPAMRKDNGRVAAVAFQVEWHPQHGA